MWFPTADDIIAAHDETIAIHGGEPGLIRRGGVEAALERARYGPFVSGDLAERAAFLLRGIVLDHPFVDGNKRAAYAGIEMFLEVNGLPLRSNEEESTNFVLAVARGEHDVVAITSWLRARL